MYKKGDKDDKDDKDEKENDDNDDDDDKDEKKNDPGPSRSLQATGSLSRHSFIADHFSDLLENLEAVLFYVGDMGRYQIILFLLMIPACFFFAFTLFGQMFLAATPQLYWCKIPELAHLDVNMRRKLAAPGAAFSDSWDKCNTYATDWKRVASTLQPPDPNTPTIPCQHGYDFDLVDIPYHTVVSERGWVCEKSGYAPFAQAIFFLGSFVGGLFFGWIADRFGRVPALTASNIIGCVGGVSTIFTSGFWDFVFCRFIVGISYDTNYMMMYILLMEYVGPKHRAWVGNISISCFFGCGCMALPWIALGISNWRGLQLATALPMLIFASSPWVVPESVRWLVHVGKVKKAVKVLKKFEKVNRTKIPQDALDEFVMSCHESDQSHESIMLMLQKPLLRISQLTMMFVYMSCACAFDGLIRMSDHLGSDFFITFTLTSATEIPSSLFLATMLDKLGRRNFTAIPLFISGTLIICAMFSPKGVPQTALAVSARFFINLSEHVSTQWCTELLPTGLRAFGSAIMHVAGFLATVLSPFIVYSETLWDQLPLLILGITALSSGSASIVLPETTGLAMPQTIEDSEAIVIEHSLCLGKKLKGKLGPSRSKIV